MTVDATANQHLVRITVTTQPKEVVPGARSTLKVEVACDGGCQLEGRRLTLLDGEGQEIARAVLGPSTGSSHSVDLEFSAPQTTGTHQLGLRLDPATDKGHASELAAPLSVTVVPHQVKVSSWKVPTAIVAGEQASIFVGAKCSSNRSLAGTPIIIRDHLGQQAWAGTLSEETWPGTAALYFTEATIAAPPSEGEFTWHVETPDSDGEPPHRGSTFAFLVRAVPAPQAEVTVVAKDHATGSPVAGLQVVMHPYRAVTDQDGTARVKVVKGTFQLFVTGLDYIVFQTTVDVTDDVTINAELVVEEEVDHYDSHYR